MLNKNSIYGTSKPEKVSESDIMNDKINDCLEVLVILPTCHKIFIDS